MPIRNPELLNSASNNNTLKCIVLEWFVLLDSKRNRNVVYEVLFYLCLAHLHALTKKNTTIFKMAIKK